MGKYRCIRPNLPKVVALSKKLGYSPATTAVKIEDWQDANNKGFAVIPTIFDMGMVSLPWKENLELYKSFKLLTNQNERKILTKETAIKLAESLNEKDYDYAAEPVDIGGMNKNRWSVSLAKKLWTKNDGDSNQLSLFQLTNDGTSAFEKMTYEQQQSFEKTIRDLTARISDRIGIKYSIINRKDQLFKGKLDGNTAIINLAYATLDTPIHEILGHPIIRALKNKRQDSYIIQEDGTTSALYENLLKELETGKGKEVLDRVKRDYTNKNQYNKEDFSIQEDEQFDIDEGKRIKRFTILNSKNPYAAQNIFKNIEDAQKELKRLSAIQPYTLEEQQEEAFVELLGLMTAEKLDNVKDGKLISLLKRLLKEMKVFIRSLINQKEVEIDKLPDNMTINDLADLLAYSNSKLILPGYEVEYTTPDNQKFKTYQEASNHISKLAKSVKDVDLSNIEINPNLEKEIKEKRNLLEKQLKQVEDKIREANEELDKLVFTGEKMKSKFEFTDEYKEYLKQYKEFTDVNLTPLRQQEKEIYDKINEIRLEEGLFGSSGNTILNFIQKNKEYEQSKEIIEEWKKVNNIQYNPEEIYSRGQEFSSVVGAYSDFDVNLMMQNLLQHIEDNEKAGGKFAISAFTKPTDKTISHLEGGGGKIKFKIYPQSNDILWASNVDVYSGSVWDASEKVNKDKKSELLGVSYTKYPSLNVLHTIQPNLASIVDDLAHHHNELGIVLTGNNFRLEYDKDIPYTTKKIINGINSILDQKYGKLVKPEIKNDNFIYRIQVDSSYDGRALMENLSFSTLEAAVKWIDKQNLEDSKNYGDNAKNINYKPIKTGKGIQPTQTKDNLKESIKNIQAELNIKNGTYPSLTPNTPQKEYTEQALINTKIAALKEVAKKYPRSLIRSEVVQTKIMVDNPIRYNLFEEDELPFQKIPSEMESQATIYNDLLKDKITLSADNKTYIVNGESGFSRISTLIQKNRNLNNLTNTNAQALGDIFHAIAANRVATAFPEFNKHFNEISLEGVNESTILNVNAIIDPIINKAKEEGSILITELPIASIKKKKAGTIDLLEITRDKEVKMLDYKTSMYSKNPTTKYKKYAGNSEQQEHYREMIEETLGQKKKKVAFQELLYVKASVKNGISYTVSERLPVLYQTSKNKGRNKMLSSLYAQIESLIGSKNKNNAEKIDRLVAAKSKLMTKLQQDIENEEILKDAFADLAAIENAISLGIDVNSDYINFRDDLTMYKSLNQYIKLDNDKDKAMLKEIVGRASLLYTELEEKAQQLFVSKAAKDLTFEGSPIESEDDILNPIRDANGFQSFALGASYSQNPIVVYAYKQVQERLAIGRRKARDLGSKIGTLVEDLKAYTGKTGEGVYDMFLQTVKGKKTGYLIREFKAEFYDEAKQAKLKGEVSWFSENATFDNEKYMTAKARTEEYISMSYSSALASKLAYIKSSEKYEDLTDEKQQELAEKFVKEDNDKYLANWVSENKSITIYYKPKAKWRDSKWVDIKEGKYKGTVVEEFYDLYVSIMEEIEDVGLPFYVSENFIPEFKKDFMNRIINNGVGNLKLGESLINSLSINFDEAEVNKIDPFTKQFIRNIPILGKRNFNDKNTKEDFVEKEKSYDLGYSLAVFYESAVRHQELKSIESTLVVAKSLLYEQQEKITNSVEEDVKEGFDLFKLSKGLEKEIKRFEYFIDSTVYGKSRDKETGFKVTGNGITDALGLIPKGAEKVISWSKSKDVLLKYTGLNNIGYNLYSPVTNLLGGKSMQLLMGVGGRWYDTKDYTFASLVVSAGPFSTLSEDIIKANKLVEMLNVEINEFVKEEFNKTRSESKLLHKIPGPYSAMRWGENHMHKAGLIAMIKSNKHSIKWNDWKLVKGELQYVGEEEMNEGIKESFRQKVIHVNGRALGNMNPDDKILLKKWFLGRAVMQHRGWMPAMFQSHFGKRQYDYQLQEYVEGRFISLAKFITIKSLNWKKLDDIEKANVKESIAEFSILAAASLLLAALKGDDDDEERRKKLAYAIRVTDRYVAELAFFTPFEISGKGQILISPAPAVSSIKNAGRMFGNFGNVIFGDEESSEKARKKLGKSVIRTIPLYSQAERFINEALQVEIDNEK